MGDDNDRPQRVLVLGTTGRIGSAVAAELERLYGMTVVYGSRRDHQVQAWRRQGKEAVHIDLDLPDTFPEALRGIDTLFLVTGYTVAMVVQSKTIVDAAVEANVKFIVHLGVFGNGRLTYSYGAWHEMIERYVEGSGVAWSHLHPNFYMDNLLAASPIVDGKLFWFMGDKPVGWVAPEDVAAVAARVISDGPDKHNGRQYWLATQMLNGVQAAREISKGLKVRVEAVTLTPQDLIAQSTNGAAKMPSFVEPSYGAGILEWVKQIYDGRLDFDGATTTVEDLTGVRAQTLESWVRTHRDEVLAVTA